MQKKVYVAIVIRESTSVSPEYTTLYEETTLLIKANSIEDATAKVRRYFKDEYTYISAAGFKITTKIVKIEDVNEVLGIVDGDVEEINARFFRDYNAYRKFRESLEDVV